ncbi:hypothetical protein ACEPPN_011047 [Leptodophora sp. 'Broadleaf-Isolate-01']
MSVYNSHVHQRRVKFLNIFINDIDFQEILCGSANYDHLNFRDFIAARSNNRDGPRPGNGALCWSNLSPGELIDVTSFDSTGGSTLVAATADSTTSNVVMADAFDGIMATPLTNFTPWPTDNDLVTSTNSGNEAVHTNSAASGVGGNTGTLASGSAVQSAATTSIKSSSASRVRSVFVFRFASLSFLGDGLFSWVSVRKGS